VKSSHPTQPPHHPERTPTTHDTQKTALCRHYPDCGGCQTLEHDIPTQLEAKRAYLQKGLQSLGDLEILPMIPSPVAQGYRHKVMLPFGLRKQRTDGDNANVSEETVTLGCFAKDSHQVINQSECWVQDADLTQCAFAIRKWADQLALSVYDEKKHAGFLRHILLRKGSGTGQILVGMIANGEHPLPESNILALRSYLEEALPGKSESIKGIVLNHNSDKTNVTLGSRETVLFGQPFIEERLNGLTFRLRLSSFFQINPLQASTLFDLAVRDFKPGQKVLDLYAGTGTFTLWAARKTGYAEGWEESPAAIQSAKEAATLNGLGEKAHFVLTEVGAQLKDNPELLRNYDALVVDPPRKGLEESLTNALIGDGPDQVVYVSCNPNSLARDLGWLKSSYHIDRVQPVDMMPHTRHIETVVHLRRRE
jgi:23S rRNA (uracil1939-C5)-methyltransferase